MAFKYKALQAAGEEGRKYTCLFLIFALDGVSGQRLAPGAHYPQEKDPRYPLYRRLGGPPLVWTQRLEEKAFTSAGDRNPVV
jgi:hypothetical protein